MSDNLAEGAPMILDLLNYIEQVEKLKLKPAFTVPNEYFVAYQYDLNGFPDLHYNLQISGDDVWLRIPRLQEIPAPDLEDDLFGWVTLSKSPDKAPEIKSDKVIFDSNIEVGHEHLSDHPEIQTLFDWYVVNLWKPWAQTERLRRKTISLYNKLFSFQQAIASEGAETPIELVWGIGNATWKKEGYSTAVKHPLLTQPCEIALNSSSYDIEIRPRDVPPKLETDCYAEMGLAGVKQLEAYWVSALTSGANRVNPFESSTYEGTLNAAVAHLDPTGSYEARMEDGPAPLPTDKLRIVNSWVIYGRKRSGDIFIEDIRRLKKKVEEAVDLPGVIRSFVERGSSEITPEPEQSFRGLSSSDGGQKTLELFFPMAYNDEQVSIVKKLHGNDGVVVQGPPGTGKTHTIANVICHYLAQGKRVLVTAKGESALAVLQEKLPPAVRPLSVALLSDERDGNKQFEHSIQTIANAITSIHEGRTDADIKTLESKLDHLHAKISSVDQQVSAYAGHHMKKIMYNGREVSPEELAKVVLEHADEHQWFDDSPPPITVAELPFGEPDINALRTARMTVRDDLPYAGVSLPTADSFPPWSDLLGVHRDLLQARAIDVSVTQGDYYRLANTRLETFEKAQLFVKFLEERKALRAKLLGTPQHWKDELVRKIADRTEADPMLQAMGALCAEIRGLDVRRKDLVIKAVEVPVHAEANLDFSIALNRLIHGKSAFGFGFGKGEARNLLAAVSVSGVKPVSADDWTLVRDMLEWRLEFQKVQARWNALSDEFAVQDLKLQEDANFIDLAVRQSAFEDAKKMLFTYDAALHKFVEDVFGSKVASTLWELADNLVAKLHASAIAHLEKGKLAHALHRLQDIKKILQGHSGEIVEKIKTYLSASIGITEVSESALHTVWGGLMSELDRLQSVRPSLDLIARTVAEIVKAGAKNWAHHLKSVPATVDLDPVIPINWFEAWNWRLAVTFLDQIDGHHHLRELFEERKTLTNTLSRTYQDLIAAKTWLGVYRNSPPDVRQALQAYLNAVQAMGAGTGVRAVRHRKSARDAMLRAYKAVPCWILPQWRVSETLPPELGLFDLVVIDEASQSDIWALPALLRARKMLVVGDHKQVSPSAVGMAEVKITELTNRFLGNQPHGSEMTPDKSIYDLARVVFAGNSVMLKEHFRCVPAIIEFSNRMFYNNDIRPLRVPKANERLDPPLIDVYVKGGHRKGDVNPPEALAIIEEIEAILADPNFEGRSIGVVTLLGTEQAAYIHDLVHERISPVDIIARQIAVGPPPVFQGRERDIMMVSMVVGPGDRGAGNRADMHQRFNVAFSRARDRMYLFRSVNDTEFKEDSLNGKVIQHFKRPFHQETRKVQALRELCESGFEFEMFDELIKRGYRVQPQVKCGAYRIDFVVEGNEGRRLAVECDGDQFHGPGQWQDDMTRQRVLERAGWTFWRCFASSFVRRREEVLNDLVSTLNQLSIEPLGSDAADNTVWVHYKVADPMKLEPQQEEL